MKRLLSMILTLSLALSLFGAFSFESKAADPVVTEVRITTDNKIINYEYEKYLQLTSGLVTLSDGTKYYLPIYNNNQGAVRYEDDKVEIGARINYIEEINKWYLIFSAISDINTWTYYNIDNTRCYVNGKEQKLKDVGTYGNVYIYEMTTPTAPIDPGNPFTDVKKTDYYRDAIVWALENKITTGTSPTTFSPTANCKRQDVVTFLWRAAGSPERNATAKFSDVPSNAYYAKAVDWAVETGITTGVGGGKFNPNGICTREQFVTFLWRAANKPTPKGQNGFTDVKAGEYYTDAVTWAAENGITTGTGNNKFSPAANCQRGQVVTFLHRYYK